MKRDIVMLTAGIALLLAPLPARAEPGMVEKGRTVEFDYTLTVDGAVVDSSAGRTPLKYVHGSGQIIPGLERQLEGLKPGDKRQITLAPEEGYGASDPALKQEFPRESFPDTVELKEGMIIQLKGSSDQPLPATVSAIQEQNVMLDFNHPLAGKQLVFDVQMISVD